MNPTQRGAMFGVLSAAGEAFTSLGKSCKMAAYAFTSVPPTLAVMPDPQPAAAAPAAPTGAGPAAPGPAPAPTAAPGPAPAPTAAAPQPGPHVAAAPPAAPDGAPTKAGVKAKIQTWVSKAAGDKAELGRRGAAIQAIFTELGARAMGDLDAGHYPTMIARMDALIAHWAPAGV